MRATLRWAHADLRAHRGAALVTVVATAGIIVSLLLAGAFFTYAANPWQRVFTQSSGAHVWVHTRAAADAGSLARLDGVEAASGPFRTARATIARGGTRASLELRAAGTEEPRTARPLLTSGSWPAKGTDDEMVLESSLARALWAEPGDSLIVDAPDDPPRTLRVAGIADSAEPRYDPGETRGVAWVLPSALTSVESHQDHLGQVIGLRLKDPTDTDFAVQRAVTELGADQITGISLWQRARADAEEDDRLLGQLLGLFGLGALLAAALAVGGAVTTRVRGHLRDIAVLKAIGFAPGQVVRMFLVQHLGLSLLGVVCGAVLAEVLGPHLPGRIGEGMTLWQALPEHTWVPFAISGGAIVFIAVATCLAAWRAGRVAPVPVARAATDPGRRMSGTARRALGMRVPPALVLGWRSAFHRPVRSLAAIGRLTLPLLLITVAVGAWTTLDRFESHPEKIGLAAPLAARAESLTDGRARELLAANPDVTAAYPGTETEALVPGQTGTITLQGLGTAQRPYPFSVAEGRPAHGEDEAVAGQGLLDLLDLKVGDWVRMTVGGSPQVLHIVGRSIEPEQGGRVISTSIDTLREREPSLRPDFYHLTLRPGADPKAVSQALADASDSRLEVREIPNPADRLSAVRGVTIGLIAVLGLIGLAELSTTIGAGVRDRRRDLLALKAIGLTPRQVAAVIVAGTGFTALAAALAGTVLGTVASGWIIDLQGRSSGMGAGIAQPPPPGILLLIGAAAVAGAVAVSALPAARAVRGRLADAAGDVL
ncbi:FtsX-like permease family protein [Streptomyces sp. NPDC005322]|uniref:ABC transporter permease n=1 Tax=unclassified Streptomyces TaxID=2593676 RepID=UPI0033B02D73